MLPNYGVAPTPKQSVWELRLSHWRARSPSSTVKLNWAYRKFHHLFGSFTYLGRPVFGFKSTSVGNPLDTFGRNLYVDTLNSAYGSGWKRENSFLMHNGTGKFCYGFYKHTGAGRSPPGRARTTARRSSAPASRRTSTGSGGARCVRPGLRPRLHDEQKSFYSDTRACKAV